MKTKTLTAKGFLTSRWFLVWVFIMFTYTALLITVWFFAQRNGLCQALAGAFMLSLLFAGTLSRYIEETRRS